MTNWHGNGGGWGGDAPVYSTNFEYVWGGKTWTYPDVWITVQRYEPTAEETGRSCIWHYTPNTDADGYDALHYGAHYYDEGMSVVGQSADDRERRLLCFEAAELLYLHASTKGNPIGDLNLGYVYSYDRCEGCYGKRRYAYRNDYDPTEPFSPDEQACVHFRRAAEAGLAEGCYKLGDLLREGRGCEPDFVEAYQWFSRAYELGQGDPPVIWGSAALRLGRAHEEGEGCEQSFSQAEHWYELATTGLGIAVREGEGWYRGALRHAEHGLTRVRQELSGQY